MLKTPNKKFLALGSIVVVCLALVVMAALFTREKPQPAVTSPSPKGTGFLSISGASGNKISVSFKAAGKTEIAVAETTAPTDVPRIFDYVVNQHGYVIAASVVDDSGAEKKISIAVDSTPMMIVMKLGGFSSGEGLDLYVGKNNISSWTAVDWGGNLQQTIPLPLEPSGPFCLVIGKKNGPEDMRVCHVLPPDPYQKGGLL